jgi:hypothetical protein
LLVKTGRRTSVHRWLLHAAIAHRVLLSLSTALRPVDRILHVQRELPLFLLYYSLRRYLLLEAIAEARRADGALRAADARRARAQLNSDNGRVC